MHKIRYLVDKFEIWCTKLLVLMESIYSISCLFSYKYTQKTIFPQKERAFGSIWQGKTNRKLKLLKGRFPGISKKSFNMSTYIVVSLSKRLLAGVSVVVRLSQMMGSARWCGSNSLSRTVERLFTLYLHTSLRRHKTLFSPFCNWIWLSCGLLDLSNLYLFNMVVGVGTLCGWCEFIIN